MVRESEGRAGHWRRHVVLNVLDSESPGFGDVTGDGRPEIICCSESYIDYAEADWSKPDQLWAFRAVSPESDCQRHCVGTVGLYEEKIRGYVDYKARKEQRQEQFRFSR